MTPLRLQGDQLAAFLIDAASKDPVLAKYLADMAAAKEEN